MQPTRWESKSVFLSVILINVCLDNGGIYYFFRPEKAWGILSIDLLKLRHSPLQCNELVMTALF